MMPHDTKSLLASFRDEEVKKLRIIESYVYNARSNYVPLHREAHEGMTATGALDWAAVNTGVRVAAMELMVGALEVQLSELRSQFPTVSSLLVSANQWVTDIGGPHREIVTDIRGVLTELFQESHYVGAIEPALYPRRQIAGVVRKGVVSWHAHLLAWGTDRGRLDNALSALNEKTEGPLYGVPPASMRSRSWKTALNCIGYFLKTPAKSYSTRRIAERIDPQTGEIFPEHDRQYAQRLRPGEHIHLRNILRDFTLDDLLLFGGTGRELVAPMQREISRDRRHYQQRRRQWPLSQYSSKLQIAVAPSRIMSLR